MKKSLKIEKINKMCLLFVVKKMSKFIFYYRLNTQFGPLIYFMYSIGSFCL